MRPAILVLCALLAGCDDREPFTGSDGTVWTWDGDSYVSDRVGNHYTHPPIVMTDEDSVEITPAILPPGTQYTSVRCDDGSWVIGASPAQPHELCANHGSFCASSSSGLACDWSKDHD